MCFNFFNYGSKEFVKSPPDKWGDASVRIAFSLALGIWLATGSFLWGGYIFLAGMVVIFIVFFNRGVLEVRRTRESGVEKVDRMPAWETVDLLYKLFDYNKFEVEIVYPQKDNHESEDSGIAFLLVKEKREKFLMTFFKSRLKSHVEVDKRLMEQVPVLLKKYRASRLVVVTNGFFDREVAASFSRSRKIELWDRNELIKLLRQIGKAGLW